MFLSDMGNLIAECLSTRQLSYSVLTLNLYVCVPYSLNQMPWLLFISLCNFVWLLFESGIYY